MASPLRAVVTGGTAGIGRAMVHCLVMRGYAVTTCGRDGNRIEQLRAEEPSATVVRADLTTDAGLLAFTEAIQASSCRLDLLVNNAAINQRLRVTDGCATSAEISAEVMTNVAAPIQMINTLLPLLERSPRAAIVNLSSIVGVVPHGAAPVYCATKAASRMFTLALRESLRGSSISIHDLMPPPVDTEMASFVRKPKIPPADFATRALDALERGELDIGFGTNRWIARAHRLSPRLAGRMIS